MECRSFPFGHDGLAAPPAIRPLPVTRSHKGPGKISVLILELPGTNVGRTGVFCSSQMRRNAESSGGRRLCWATKAAYPTFRDKWPVSDLNLGFRFAPRLSASRRTV
jgi:hypothetical protein